MISIILPAHERLRLALYALGDYYAPDPQPSSVDQFDADTDSLSQIRAQLVCAVAAVSDLQRHRAIEREDLAHDLARKADELGMTSEQIHGVANQFTQR